jgi:hypothetical protein
VWGGGLEGPTHALEVAGVEFTNGDQSGVRTKANGGAGGMAVEDLNASNDE